VDVATFERIRVAFRDASMLTAIDYDAPLKKENRVFVFDEWIECFLCQVVHVMCLAACFGLLRSPEPRGGNEVFWTDSASDLSLGRTYLVYQRVHVETSPKVDFTSVL